MFKSLQDALESKNKCSSKYKMNFVGGKTKLITMIKIRLTIIIIFAGLGLSAQEMPFRIKGEGLSMKSLLSQRALLKKYLGDEKHVMLGEPTHGDGSIMEYKVQLIKELHEKHGFDVILFESDMLGLHIASTIEHEGIGEVINKTLPSMWKNSTEFQELVSYIDQQNKSGDSLFIGGFDSQLTQSSIRHFNSTLPIFFKNNNIVLSKEIGWNELDEHRNFFSALVLLINKAFTKNPTLISKVDIKRFEGTLRMLIEESVKVNSNDGKIWAQALKNVSDYLPLLYKNNQLPYSSSVAEISLRDSVMANNYIFQANSIFNGKKIVSWAATDHIRRNFKHEKAKKMGQHLNEKLRRPPYVVGFTAGEGTYYNYLDKKVYPIPNSERGSFEEFAKHSNKEDFFLNLKSEKNSTDKEPSNLSISMRPLGYYPISANWALALDAIIYVDFARASSVKDKE